MTFLESLFHNTLLRVIVALNLIVGVVGSALVLYIQSQQTVVTRADSDVAEPIQQAEKALAALKERSTRAQAAYTERLNAAKANIAADKVRIAKAEAAVAVKQQEATAAKQDAEAKMARLTQPLIELRTRLETEINQMDTKVAGLSALAVCLADVEMEWSGYRLSDLGRDPRLAPPGWRDTRHPDASRLFGNCARNFTSWVNRVNSYGAYAVGRGSPYYCRGDGGYASQEEADRAVMDYCKKDNRVCAIMFHIVPPFTMMADLQTAATTVAPQPPRAGGLLGIIANARTQTPLPSAADPIVKPDLPVATRTPAPPPPAQQGSIVENYDLEGGDVDAYPKGIADISFSECQDRCRKTGGCVAVSFDKWNTKCYLKRTAGTAYLNPRAVTWLPTGGDVTRATTTEHIPIKKSCAYQSDSSQVLWRVPLPLSECVKKCDDNENCIAVSRSRADQMCIGAHIVDNRKDDPGSDCASKYQDIPQ